MNQEENSGKSPAKPKKSKWWLVGCGGGLLIIIVLVFAFGLFGSSYKSSSSQDEEDIVLSKDELVNYFVEETTIWGAGNIPITLMKWDKPEVTISIADTAAEGGDKAIESIISKFNQNSTKVKLKQVAADGDTKIYFQASAGGAAGSSGPSTGGDSIIDNASVKLSEEAAMFSSSLESVLTHEIFHSLGFVGHYSGEVCRLMSKSVCGSHITINEERLVQMMYSTDIPAGSNETQIRAYFQTWTPK